MAKKISVTSIAFILLWMVCITTQKKTERPVKCKKLAKKYDRIGKKLKKGSCEEIPVDGLWEEWIETTTCTVTCGGGTKAFSRNCIKPQNGGKACEGDASKTDTCGEEECPIDGLWEEWIETTTCTVTCGGGTKAFSRNCIKPQNGGKACEGDASKTDTCGEEECPSTFKECDNPVPVANYKRIPWNPDTQSITVTSDVQWNHNQGLSVFFFDAYSKYTGNVQVRNQSGLSYVIGWCYTGANTVWKRLPVTPPTEIRKTWTFTYNYAEQRVVYHCNGVEVLNVVLSSTCGRSDWRSYWGRKPTKIWFNNIASSKYCFSSN